MALFHAVTWQEGNFDRTASVLSFSSKAAREAYPPQCAQRVENIDSKKKAALIRDGRLQRIAFWDAGKPTEFKFSL
nr:hypothetical protein [uncultured Albidiferax sp.]